MAAPNTKVAKTIDGIDLNIDMRVFSDMRFIRAFTGLFRLRKKHEQAQDAGDAEAASEITAEMMDALDGVAGLIFRDDAERVQGEFMAAHDGFLPFEEWLSFVGDVVMAYQKNGDARPAPERK